MPEKSQRNTYPGEILLAKETVVINAGRKSIKVLVRNTGDRPIQVGSHYHFFEVNKALEFDRSKTFGMHLDVPAGTSVRFEPGDEKEIALVEFGGSKYVWGLNSLANGTIRSASVSSNALAKAKNQGFKGA